jgi:hypothetical protein
MGDYTKDLKKFLRENGCTFERQGKGDHEIWYSLAPVTEGAELYPKLNT